MATATMVVEDMFEAAHRAFFSTGDASLPDTLSAARETVFAKEVPADAASAAVVAQQKDDEVLVHA